MASRSAARLTLARSVFAQGTTTRRDSTSDALVWLPARAALAAKLNSPELADAAIREARLAGGGINAQAHALRAAKRAVWLGSRRFVRH